MQTLINFLDQQDIQLLPYQEEVIQTFQKDTNGIIEAPTGRGKTLAMALAIIHDAQEKNIRPKMVWVTPMRALARDTAHQLTTIFSYFYDDIKIILRTSDSSSYQKKKARDNDWDILITTPESCALFTTYSDMIESLKQIQVLVVDEWHVLVHQKRGILFELFLSWLSHFNSTVKRWGLSATISSITDACQVLSPNQPVLCVSDPYKKEITGKLLLPVSDNRSFRSLGKNQLPQLIDQIKSVQSAIIFTNTRSQSEQWYQLLLESKEFKKTEIAIHHSAVSAQDRANAEHGIKTGTVRCIVATSSLDLGVDLEPVDLVFHIGSPKGMARLKQRAGRSGHSPFESSSIVMVPRHGFEVIESVAAISNLDQDVQDDIPYSGMPMDVLMQHLINICCGAPFSFDELVDLVTNTATYQTIEKESLKWLLDFCCNEHTLLKAYPEHVKLVISDGNYQTNSDKLIQKSQRFCIGAITSDDYLIVKYSNQRTLGTIEEQFIRQLKPTDTFLFSGHNLAVMRIQDDVVYVKKSKQKLPKYTRWYGGFMSYSSQLSDYLINELNQFHQSIDSGYPLLQKFLDWQAHVSCVPKSDECLIEIIPIQGCETVFMYPFCGRAANHALAMSLTHLISQQFKCMTAMTVNDYGLMIQCDKKIDLSSFNFHDFMNLESVKKLSLASFNHNEMILQEFRQICLISGLIYRGLPGRLKSGRYTQSSVRILYDIFKEFDPNNLLLNQARETVFNTQLFPQQLQDRLAKISERLVIKKPSEISPFGYTLYNEQLSAKMDGNGH